MTKDIINNDVIYGRIIRKNELNSGDCFFTNKNDDIQFGILNFKQNHKTGAHYHNHPDDNSPNQVDEIIIVNDGSARIDFYDNQGVYLKSTEISKGDIAILFKGGHNITYTSDTNIFVFKNDSNADNNNETRIIGANKLEINIEN